MKTTAILAAAAAAAFLFTGAPTFAAETEAAQEQTQAKRCYRTFHKAAYRVRVPCRRAIDIKAQPMRPAPSEPAPQPVPEKKP